MAEITLTWPTGYRTDRGREYRIDIDRKKVGSIKIGETKVFTVPRGRHELQLKQDWASSERLQVDLCNSEQAMFVCAPRIKENDDNIVTGFRMAYWATFGCRRYIDLRRGSEIVEATESKRGLISVDGPKLFAIALVISVVFWILTGQDVVFIGVMVAGMAIVVSGLIARGISRATIRASERIRRRRRS